MDEVHINSNADEITLKELILVIQSYFSELIKNWKIILLICLPFAAYFFFKSYTEPITYGANLTFMLNEEQSGGMGQMGSLLGQFGIRAGRGGKLNLEKITDLSKSRNIVSRALFSISDFGGEKQFLANHLIDEYSYHNSWLDSEFEGFYFKHKNLDSFDLIENSVLKSLHGLIVGSESQDGLFSSNINEDTGIITLSTTTSSESLSIELVNHIYDNLSEFYRNKSIERQQKAYNIAKSKVDSLQKELAGSEASLAAFKDRSGGLIFERDKAREGSLQRKVSILSLAVGEAMRTLEMSDFSLRNETPFVQVIDRPIPPLSGSSSSLPRALIMGGLLGCFIGGGLVIARRVYRDTMK